MQEPYKEMYIHLYKTLEVLEDACQKLAEKIDFCLAQTTELYVERLTEQAQTDREDIETRFAKLFED